MVGSLQDERDRFPRLALPDDGWYEFVQRLVMGAEGIVAIATRVSSGLVAETRAVEWLRRADDTLLITSGNVDANAFGSFRNHLVRDGNLRALSRNRFLRSTLEEMKKLNGLPLQERLAALRSPNARGRPVPLTISSASADR
ncbi:MAG: hypothetical protein ACLQA5_04240 [Solirubrobacteraceae bacterium]